MEPYVRRSYGLTRNFFIDQDFDPEEFLTTFKRESEVPARRFNKWLENHRDYPEEYINFILRDVLHYTKEEIMRLSLEELSSALHYAITTYVRRDLAYILGEFFKDKKPSKNSFMVEFKQPEIEEYIRNRYREREAKK